MAESIGCSRRGTSFNSQHPHGALSHFNSRSGRFCRPLLAYMGIKHACGADIQKTWPGTGGTHLCIPEPFNCSHTTWQGPEDKCQQHPKSLESDGAMSHMEICMPTQAISDVRLGLSKQDKPQNSTDLRSCQDVSRRGVLA